MRMWSLIKSLAQNWGVAHGIGIIDSEWPSIQVCVVIKSIIGYKADIEEAAVGDQFFSCTVGVLLLLAEFWPPRHWLTLILSVTTTESISHSSCYRCHLIVAELTDKKYQSKF